MRKFGVSLSSFLLAGSALAEVGSSALPNNPRVEGMFGYRFGTGSFYVEETKRTSSNIAFKGRDGEYSRNSLQDGILRNVRYMTFQEAMNAADFLNAPGIRVQDYGLDIACNYVVAADWLVRSSSKASKAFWCFESDAPGARYKGVFWLSSADWANEAFTGVWEGNLN